MKSSTRYSLTSASAFFALCASVVACGPGGGYYSYPSYSSYQSCPSNSYDSYPSEVTSVPVSEPTVVSQPPAATVKVAPTPVAPVAKVPAVKTAPKSHITVVSAAKTQAPVGRIKLASPVAATRPATATIRQVPAEETAPAPVKPVTEVAVVKPEVAKTTPEPVKPAKTEEPVAKVDLNKSLESLEAAKEETSKIAESLKGLVGTWLAVSRQGDGELSTVELQLNDNGWAKLTVPGADGKPSTTTRKVEVDNNELKLTGGDADVMLGKLVEFNSRQMVLERSGGQVTFVRP